MRGAPLWPSLLLSRSSAARQSSPLLRSFFTSTPLSAKGNLNLSTFQQNIPFLFRAQRSRFPGRFRSLRFNSNNAKKPPSQQPNPTPHLGSPEPAPSLSQRLKKLSREYGWSALGVYLALTALDLPFCYLAVRMLGTDRIGHYEHVIVEAVMNVVRIPFPNLGKSDGSDLAPVTAEVAEATAREGDVAWTEDIDEAQAKNQGAEASLWTQLALAYAIHKTFIFIRVPITAAITPKVVKTLRGWGWNIGKRTPKSP